MNDRQKDILAFVINEYIKSAQPVGSALLSEKAGMDLSPATYRNELAELEEEGYLEQPHTSAGRVPTEKAYHLFVNEFLQPLKLNISSSDDFKLSVRQQLEDSDLMKVVARQLVDRADEAVIIALSKKEVYYTGLTNLFAKPEFSDQKEVVSLTSVVDKIDLVIDKVFDNLKDLEVLIGSNNPFGNSCSAIVAKYRLHNGEQGMVAILGPMRMDYEKNIALISRVKQLIEKIDRKK